MSRIDDKPGHLLRRCHQITVSIFFDECKEFDLTPMQYSILSVLDGIEGLDQTNLGMFASLDKSTTAGTIRRLELKELIERRRDKADRRSIIVSLSPLGRELVSKMRPRVESVHARLLSALDPHERPLLIHLLTKIASKLGEDSRVRSSPLSEAYSDI